MSVPSISSTAGENDWFGTCELIEYDGRLRRYRRYEPPACHARSPMLIELHGSGLRSEAQMRSSGFHRLARRRGFALIAPEAIIPLTLPRHEHSGFAWHVPGAPLFGETYSRGGLPDDIGFVTALIEAAAGRPVFLVGYSGGARLASHLMFRLGRRLAGVGLVAGLQFPLLDRYADPPPVIAFHGMRDTLNAYAGSGDARWPVGPERTLDAFAGEFGWTRSSAWRGSQERRFVLRDDAGRLRLRFHALARGGHDWPGSRDAEHHRYFGASATDIDASDEILAFFEDYGVHIWCGAREDGNDRQS